MSNWEKRFEKFNKQWEEEGYLSMDDLKDFIKTEIRRIIGEDEKVQCNLGCCDDAPDNVRNKLKAKQRIKGGLE